VERLVDVIQAPKQEIDPRKTLAWLAVVLGVVGLAWALSGCSGDRKPAVSRGEECARYCHPLPLQGIQSTGAFWGSCICGTGPVCADGRLP
jgi:hypothetical protein